VISSCMVMVREIPGSDHYMKIASSRVPAASAANYFASQIGH
jgi:hypothetical protein